MTNVWIPDGYKDIPVDRRAAARTPAIRWTEFRRAHRPRIHLDAVESQALRHRRRELHGGLGRVLPGLRGLAAEAAHLDAGHFHPTEVISDKISPCCCSGRGLLLMSAARVRWDSDHVVILDDELKAIAKEIVRGDFLDGSTSA